MKRCLLISAAIIAISAGSALAAGPYIGANVGLGIVHDSDVKFPDGTTNKATFDSGLAFDIAAGFKFDNGVRAEFEFGYLSADIDKVNGEKVTGKNDITSMSYMVNGFYDFTMIKSPVIPYVGVGLGMINGEVQSDNGDGTTTKKSDTVFGYQMMVGATYAVVPNVNIDLGYRFQSAASDLEIKDNDGSKSKVPYMSSSILAGVRYNF